MSMNEQEQAMFTDLVQHFSAVQLVFRAALSILNQEVPEFRERLIASLRDFERMLDVAKGPNTATILAEAIALAQGLKHT